MQTYTLRETNLVSDHGGDRPYVLKVRDLPPEEKPREKLIKYGPDALSVAELLAVVLNVGTKKEDVLEMSRRLIKEYGERAIADQKNPQKIGETLNLPLIKSCQIAACFELGRRFFKKNETGKPDFIRTARQVYDYLKDMRDLPKEHLRGIYLNSHYRLVHDEVISIGSLTANIVHPREVFRPALEYGATALILAHNHPSDEPAPSDADTEITRQLVEAGRILGIALIDHVIVTKNHFASVPVDYE